MGWKSRLLQGLFLVFCFSACGNAVSAKQMSPPEWYRLSAVLATPPMLENPVEVLATLTCSFGEMRQIEIGLHLPAGWTPASPAERLDKLASGSSRVFRFSLRPGSPLPNGSIGCWFSALAPKAAMADSLRQMGDQGKELAKVVLSRPDRGTGFTDIPFALFPEEGFFPLGADMWVGYDDRLKQNGMQRGPSFFHETLISPHQATTDAEMYQRLVGQLAANPGLAQTLKESGIDLDRKRQDVLGGLYVLAQESFLKSVWAEAEERLARFEEIGRELPPDRLPELRIAAGNLRGLVLWSKGDRRAAEKALQDTFYARRKSPAQRYVLRNLALLALQRGDNASAREGLRLALEFKPQWPLATREFQALGK